MGLVKASTQLLSPKYANGTAEWDFGLRPIIKSPSSSLDRSRKQRQRFESSPLSLRMNPSVHRMSEGGAKMELQKSPKTTAAPPPPITSCRKKKKDDANFLEDLKDHIDEFMSASMDEHKSCFKKTVQKMFGMSKVVTKKNSAVQEVESSLPLRTTMSE